MSRDQTPFVEFDPDTATGWLGGFFGNGVAATNLGARAMADLILVRGALADAGPAAISSWCRAICACRTARCPRGPDPVSL